MLRLTVIGARIGKQATLVILEGLLLLVAGFGLALIGEGRYHPIFAGEPIRALSFWQRGLGLALFAGLLELALVLAGRGRPGLAFPIGVTELRNWFQPTGSAASQPPCE